MSGKNTIRTMTLAAFLVAVFSATSTTAGSDKKSGKRRGPPPQAIEACAEQEEGSACAFSGRRGDVSGTCLVPPRGEHALVCAPENRPPRDREEEES